MALINWSSYLSQPGNILQGTSLAMRGAENFGRALQARAQRELARQNMESQAEHLRNLDEVAAARLAQDDRRLDLAEQAQQFRQERALSSEDRARQQQADVWLQRYIRAAAAGREADAAAYKARYDALVGEGPAVEAPVGALAGETLGGPQAALPTEEDLGVPAAPGLSAEQLGAFLPKSPTQAPAEQAPEDPRGYAGPAGVEWVPPGLRSETLPSPDAPAEQEGPAVSPEHEVAQGLAADVLDPWKRQQRKQAKAVADVVRQVAGGEPVPPGFIEEAEALADNLMQVYDGDSGKALDYLTKWIKDKISAKKKKRRVGRVAAGLRPTVNATAGDYEGIDPNDELKRRKFGRQQFNDIYNKYGIAETVKAMEVLKEQVRVLTSTDPADTAAQKQAVKMLIAAVESGKVSDKDFALMVSGDSLWGQLRKLYHANIGAFDDELDRFDPKQLQRLARAAQSALRTRTAQYKDAFGEVMALRDSLEQRRDAYLEAGNRKMADQIDAELYQVESSIQGRFFRDMWEGKLGTKRRKKKAAKPEQKSEQKPEKTTSNPFLD